MENTGFVQIPRSVLDWEYADDREYLFIYLYLFFKANYEEKRWHGITVHRGELVTSREKIAKETGISVQKVRMCLDKLSSTQKITRKTTNKYTLISVKDYVSNPQNNQQTTNKQPQLNKENKENNKYSDNFSSKNTKKNAVYASGATISYVVRSYPTRNPSADLPEIDPEANHKRIVALKKRVLRID